MFNLCDFGFHTCSKSFPTYELPATVIAKAKMNKEIKETSNQKKKKKTHDSVVNMVFINPDIYFKEI